MASYDKGGRLVAGDPEKPKEVTDYIVVEKFFGAPQDWRICGKLIPQSATAAAADQK